jgi:hypothetical protein
MHARRAPSEPALTQPSGGFQTRVTLHPGMIALWSMLLTQWATVFSGATKVRRLRNAKSCSGDRRHPGRLGIRSGHGCRRAWRQSDCARFGGGERATFFALDGIKYCRDGGAIVVHTDLQDSVGWREASRIVLTDVTMNRVARNVRSRGRDATRIGGRNQVKTTAPPGLAFGTFAPEWSTEYHGNGAVRLHSERR